MTPLAVPAHHVIEIAFHSGKRYEHPFSDVHLDVHFSRPDGKTLVVPAFWAGDNGWKVRYSSGLPGEHHYLTQCRDTDNHDLHGLRGVVSVSTHSEDNPLLRHGAPQVAADKRHFCHEDGTPFFWLGDTWWLGLTQRLAWPEEFQALAADRQAKGFSVVQLVAGLYPDMPAFDPRGASASGFPWEADFTTINPAFFDEADTRIAHLVERGLCPCILGTWGYYLPWLGAEKMKQHWRYVMARWGAYPVVWVAAGEQMMPWYLSQDRAAEAATLKQAWSQVIRHMREINAFNRMITTHPQQTARGCVDDPQLLDFEMQQTGHGSPTASHAAQATAGWHTQPVMPVISGESRYEALSISPEVSTTDTRQAFWAHLLNSGCAGHTYGANGVWQVNREQDPFGNSPSGSSWGAIPWRQSMHLPGSSQLALAKAMLLTLPWHQMAPIGPAPQPRWKRWLQRLRRASGTIPGPIAAAASQDGSVVICYAIHLSPFQVPLEAPPDQPLQAHWFDPVNGRPQPATASNPPWRGQPTFTPPGKNADQQDDWVLVIRTRPEQTAR